MVRLRGWAASAALIGTSAMLLMAAGACGDDGDGGASDDEAAVEKTIRDVAAAWAAQDFDAFAALHTPDGLRAQFSDADDPDTTEGQREAFELFSSDDTQIIEAVADIEVEGDGATANVDLYNEAREDPAPVAILLSAAVGLVQEGDAWRVDSLGFKDSEAREGTQVVDVEANEFAFSITEEIESGDVAFAIKNVGEQPHHVVIERVPEDFDIEAALMSDEEPQGLVHIGSTPPWEPGVTQTAVFTGDLEPGRYVMLCFMPDTGDPEGPPHAVKGMYKDFTIE